MTQMETKLCSDLETRYKWICANLSERYKIGERYGEQCLIVNKGDVEAIIIHRIVFPGKSHSLVIEYAFAGDGFFSEDGDLYPIEDYPDQEQMLIDMLAEIEG